MRNVERDDSMFCGYRHIIEVEGGCSARREERGVIDNCVM